jgi:hypothetical protein
MEDLDIAGEEDIIAFACFRYLGNHSVVNITGQARSSSVETNTTGPHRPRCFIYDDGKAANQFIGKEQIPCL